MRRLYNGLTYEKVKKQKMIYSQIKNINKYFKNSC